MVKLIRDEVEQPEPGVLIEYVMVPGPPGAKGDTGLPGTTDHVTFNVEAGFTIPAYHIVVPRVLDESVRLADNQFLPHADRPYWLTLNAGLAGEQIQVLSTGLVENPAWSWTMGAIFLSAGGTMTQIAPGSPDLFGVKLGHAVTSTAMFFCPADVVVFSV